MADIPQNARDLAQEVLQFCAVAKDNPEEYGATAAEITDLETKAQASLDAEDDKATTEAAYRAAVSTADSVAGALADAWRPVRRDAYDTATDQELDAAGLAPHKTRSLSTPLAPQNLVANVQGDGTIRLFWKNGDDVASTLYDIEAQIGDSLNWALVYTTGARKFDHKNQPPGVKIVYRVSARRRGISSSPSNLAQAY